MDIFLDIETTGLKRRSDMIYLIGICYDNFKTRLFFNDDGISEKKILTDLINFLENNNISRIITYNGNSFDIPFINEKLKKYEIDFSLSKYESFDLYRVIMPYKNILSLNNLTLKTIEKFLNIYRENTYSGKELIDIYTNYLGFRDEENKTLLFNHNLDDIKGLKDVMIILNYIYVFNGDFTINKSFVNNGNLCVNCYVNHTLPEKINYKSPYINIEADNNSINFSIEINNNQVKHYYKNYKDYYFLKFEKYAIHKSIATFVDKSNKEKATKENCYTFVPVDNLLNNNELLKEYLINAINVCV